MDAKERYPVAEACGAKIRALRQQRGWTTHELAERAGYSQQEISAVELGRIRTSIETLARIANALDVPLYALLPVAFEGDEAALIAQCASVVMKARDLTDEVTALHKALIAYQQRRPPENGPNKILPMEKRLRPPPCVAQLAYV